MSKEEYIQGIIAIEWAMFDQVENEGGRASCQNDYRTFAIMRSSQYKCWNDIGIPEKSVGNINTPDNYIYRTDLIDAYSSFDSKLYPECEECKMLPTCLGGCPNKRLDGGVECNHIKFGMQEYLVRCTETLLSRTQKASKGPV